MGRMTFINLPVRDLAALTAFFTAVGFTFDPVFTDETFYPHDHQRRVVGDAHGRAVLRGLRRTAGRGGHAPATREVIVGLSAESREEVDDLTERAIAAAGAQSLGEPQDQGFMYMRGFRDLDGHQLVVHPHGHVSPRVTRMRGRPGALARPPGMISADRLAATAIPAPTRNACP